MSRRRRSRTGAGDHGGGGGGGGHGGGGSGRWLVSYSDFITLMMVVFMVLYSMARVDSGKYDQLRSSLQMSSIGILPLPVGGSPMSGSINTAPITPGPDPDSAPGQPAPADPVEGPPVPLSPVLPFLEPEVEAPKETDHTPQFQTPPPAKVDPAPPKDPLTALQESLEGTAAARAGRLSVIMEERGLKVQILTQVLFNEGTTDLKPEATSLLDEVSLKLMETTAPILTEGSPDVTATTAPWDLAVRRASTVVNYLVTTHNLSAHRFAVIGYGKGDGVSGIVNVVVLRQ